MKRFIGLTAPSMAVAALFAPLLGCKSDLSQQLLERELRMQEDQIYQLQDELQNASHQLDRTARENTSLKRQLGFADGDAATGGRRSPAAAGPAPAAAPKPLLAPPAIEVPGVGSPAGQAAPAPATLPPPEVVAPPRLDGVPPLPSGPRFPGAAAEPPASVVPVSATEPVAGEPPAGDGARQAGAASGRPLSREESLADAGQITHIVINPARTECFDGNGDGVSDGLAVVLEPRDGDERLVTAAGDLVLAVFEASGPPGAAPVARWEIPAQEALAHFRRTSRNRGLHFVLRWPGAPPQGDHVRVHAVLTTFEAASFETDCTVAVRR
ncbi:MAG: hypothetical protein ACKOWG_11335 [Planctomycetia bacterium]